MEDLGIEELRKEFETLMGVNKKLFEQNYRLLKNVDDMEVLKEPILQVMRDNLLLNVQLKKILEQNKYLQDSLEKLIKDNTKLIEDNIELKQRNDKLINIYREKYL